ncbi:MAG: hypothetical protein HY790_02640 [Deltaproteobacteria bacterium]|nr:hypothetical protein [Deltaproteobacteria bacterium]
MLRFAWWENFIVLALLTLFLAGPAWGKISPDEAVPFTDYGSFLGEYRAAGAFKFYDNTEALLRLAQFELSLMRYRFLKGQIQRKGDYRGLLAMVDLRLRFLKKQLHLHEMDIAAIPPRKARIPRPKKPEAKPSPEKEKPGAAKPKTPRDADQDDDLAKDTAKKEPPVSAVSGPPSPPGIAVTAPPATPGKPPEVAVTDTTKPKEEKAEEEAKPPPPPPGFWEKLKIRLHLKKKAADSG